MFTGIIESLGTVKNIVRASHSFSIEIQSDFNEKLVLGESIAVNGVCLTVAEFSGSVFKADVTPETFSRTSLKILRPGSFVNLERAMKAGILFLVILTEQEEFLLFQKMKMP